MSTTVFMQFFLANSIKCTIFAPTRTRQASLQCLNRRVVFFSYGTLFKDLHIAHPIDGIATIARSPRRECHTDGELPPPHRLLQIRMTSPTCFYDANTFVKTKQLIDAELAKSREDFIEHFLNIISPNNMKAKVDALLAAYPSIDFTAMGFPRGWKSEPLWQ